jgi:outer membrane autotransporter protein
MKSIFQLYIVIISLFLSSVCLAGGPPPPPQEPVVNTRPVMDNSCSQPNSEYCSQTFFAAFPNVAAPFLDLFIDGVTDGTNTTDRFLAGGTRSYKAAGDILSSEKFGFFLSGITTNQDRILTRREIGYDSELAGFVSGLDYRFTDDLTAGLSVGYTNTDIDFQFGMGDLDLETVTVLLHGIYSPIDNLSMNSYLGWVNLDFQGNRRIIGSRFAHSETEGDQFLTGLSAAYDVSRYGFTLSPQLSLDYLSTWIDGFSETGSAGGELNVADQRVHSLTSRTGLNATYAWSQSWGVLVPQVRLFYIHEFLNKSRTVLTSPVGASGLGGGFVTDEPDRDYYTVAAGVSTVLPYGVQLFIDYERLLSHRYFSSSYTVSGGLRIGF